MPIDEIPRHDWGPSCDAFNRQHRGWLVEVEALDPPGRSTAAPGRSLESGSPDYDLLGPPASDQHPAAAFQQKALMQGVALESVVLARSPVGEEQIVIAAEAHPGNHLTHAVQSPTRVRLEHTESGADQALYIDTPGHTVVVRFPITAPMEMLNGFVPD